MNRHPSDARAMNEVEAAAVRRALDALGVKLPRILLTPPEAAEALAMSERRLWELTQRGEIPCVRNGRSVRYRTRALEDWAERNERKGITA